VTFRSALASGISRDLRLTRGLIERLPDASMSWRPHERSFSLAELATHLARLPHWGAQILASDGYDVGRVGRHTSAPCRSRTEVLDLFDRHVNEWERAIAGASEASLAASWQLRRNGTVLESMTRLDAVERYLLHHMIHHRGQLTVYLRIAGVPLPPLYGPTADELP
jgi:uncharacterized damage-inducible protein DinB